MKTRLNIYLSPGQHEEIAALSAKRRVSKSSVIEAAVASMLSPDSADVREAAFVRRLDRHTRQLERVERDLAIAIETMALFVRFWLAVTPPLPESAQAAAKAKGAERYRDFVETLGRQAATGQQPRARDQPRDLAGAAQQRCRRGGSERPGSGAGGHSRCPLSRRRSPARPGCCAPRWGRTSAGYLEDPDIVEVMLNPDGRLWIDRLSSGLEDTGRRIPVADGERIVRLVAHHVGAEAHAGSPRVSAELPETGERFEGLLPPVVDGAGLRDQETGRRGVHARRLRRLRHHDRGAGRDAQDRRRRALERAGRGRHLDRQDDIGQCPAARSGGDRRPGRADRGHARIAMRGAEPGCDAHQGRRRVADRSGALLAPAPARSHPDRRGAGPRGARSAEGLGHGTSRRHRHDPCRRPRSARCDVSSSWCKRRS